MARRSAGPALLAAAALLLLAACGPRSGPVQSPSTAPATPAPAAASPSPAVPLPSPSPTAAPVPSPTPAPAPPLLVTVDWSSRGDAPMVWHLLTEDGTVLASLSSDAGAGGYQFTTVTRQGAYFRQRDHLVLLHPDATLTDLGALPGIELTPANSPVLVDPAGTRWIWHSTHEIPGGIDTSLYLGGVGLTPRVIAHDSGRVAMYWPVLWNGGGVLVSRQAYAGEWYSPYGDGFASNAERLDPVALTLTPVTDSGYRAGDVGADGAVVCIAMTGGPSGTGEVRLIGGGGGQRTFALPGGVTYAGSVRLSPDETTIVFGAGTWSGPGGTLSGRAYSVTVATGAMRQFGPANLVPARFLPDGVLAGTLAPTVGDGPGTAVLVDAAGGAHALRGNGVAGVSG